MLVESDTSVVTGSLGVVGSALVGSTTGSFVVGAGASLVGGSGSVVVRGGVVGGGVVPGGVVAGVVGTMVGGLVVGWPGGDGRGGVGSVVGSVVGGNVAAGRIVPTGTVGVVGVRPGVRAFVEPGCFSDFASGRPPKASA